MLYIYIFICAAVLGRSLLTKKFLISMKLFYLDKKKEAFITVTLTEHDCNFYLLTGMLFLAQDDLISPVKDMFEISWADHGLISQLQQFKYWQSFFGQIPEPTFFRICDSLISFIKVKYE